MFDKEKIEEIVAGMIKPGDFCWVVTENLREIDIEPGDYIYVAGVQAIPEDYEDPYNQRIKLVSLRVNELNIDSSQFILIDPRNVTKIDDEEVLKRLDEQMQIDFGTDDGEVEVGETTD